MLFRASRHHQAHLKHSVPTRVCPMLPGMDWYGMWWVGVLAFGIALMIGTAIYAKRQRRSDLGAAATHLGYKVYLGPTPFSPEECKGVNLFSRGYGGKWENMAAD